MIGGMVAENKRGVPFVRAFLDDLFDVRHEAHVQHPVCFVEHEILQVFERGVALREVVEQSAGCGHDDVCPGLEGIRLFAVLDAAVEHRGPEFRITGEIAECRLDLRGQFPGWFEDQGSGLVARLIELGQDGQTKRRRFAGAGLCASDHVSAFED